MGGLTSGEGGGLISKIVFLLAGTWAYIQGLIKEGGGRIYTFCEHFESTYMVAALYVAIRLNVALVCIL